MAGPDDRAAAQCHDHKFDPFTQRDFYSLGAFFADIQEPIIGHREDGMVVATAEDRRPLARLEAAWPRRRSSRPWPRSSTSPRQQWEADVAAYDVTLPELARDSKATPAEKIGRAAVRRRSRRTPGA